MENPLRLYDIASSDRGKWQSSLLQVWEASVRATHDFLSESDIATIKPQVASGLMNVPVLIAGVYSSAVSAVAFMGICERKVEMLFVSPDRIGQGIGSKLITYAREHFGIETVDCNEQNPRALAFYQKHGFAVGGRSERDSLGLPFPILHLRLSVPVQS